MVNDRYQPKHFEDNKDRCAYCGRTPAVWQQVGGEKVCPHCGTRIYVSVAYHTTPHMSKPAHR
jgi:DNA-directed RNA polymerase subunit RPC12/RpoP